MCGFTGVVTYKQKHPLTDTFMHYALRDLFRRGPDQQEIWESEDGKICFGFARLAIRDLSEHGKQPMISEDGRWVIMYNGETYNTDELIQWSELDENKLKSSSDTEIILTAITKKGFASTVAKMDGIFAIAAIDLVQHKLFLARDVLGVKPLYVGTGNDGLVFSSHYHQVLNHPYLKDKSINPSALIGYFKYGFIQPGEGLFENTWFVPPGHIAEVCTKTLSVEFNPYVFNGNVGKENLLHTIKGIVKSQLVSDVPIGTFLSGGIDSALTTACAAMINPKIESFTISVDDPRLDEAEQSKIIAKAFSVNQHIHLVKEEEVLAAINQYDESLAEPLADYSSMLTLKVCEMAKKNLTVVLSGDGGDELFWGYPRMHTFWKYYPYLKKSKLSRAIHIGLSRIKGKKIPFRLLKFNNEFDYYLSAQGLTGNRDWIDRLLTLKVKPKATYTEQFLQKQFGYDIEKWVKQTELYIHLQRVLLKVDRASMYHSLEVRTPFLSPVIIAKSNEYTYNNCVTNGRGKMPLRNLLNELIQNENLTNAKKKGFEPPMPKWMRFGLKKHIEDRLMNIPPILKPYINQAEVEIMWQEHQLGKDYSWPIWALYSLFAWTDKLKMLTNEN